MLAVVVILLVLLYLVLKATGLLDELIRIQRDPGDNTWGQFFLRGEPVEEERLEVYREFFEDDTDPENGDK
jgi:hypothetical protein